MKRFLIFPSLAAVALAFADPAPAAVMITNGDFEAGTGTGANSYQDVTGWFDYSSIDGDLQQRAAANVANPTPPSGDYWLSLVSSNSATVGRTGVYQEIGTHDAGITSYDVSFTLGSRSDTLTFGDNLFVELYRGTPIGTPANGTTADGIGGLTLVGSFELTGPAAGLTAPATFSFNATGISTDERLWLAFAYDADYNPSPAEISLIDDVSIVAVPEPSTFGMLLGGACFMLALFRRRRHS